MTTDETPIRDIGIEIDKRLHKRLGEIGDTYTLIGLAYLEGLNAQERTEKPNAESEVLE